MQWKVPSVICDTTAYIDGSHNDVIKNVSLFRYYTTEGQSQRGFIIFSATFKYILK